MLQRRALCLAAAALAACAAEPGPAGAPAAARRPDLPQPWRTLQGGFLTPALPGLGLPSPGATGLYVRWHAPTALALRGQDLLVADLASARLWRMDLMGQAVTGIAGAPVTPGLALALGADLSAWVLDAAARQVLRFGRDGRLLQTHRIDAALPSPVAIALADGGITLLVADGMGAAWSEQRGSNAFARVLQPQHADGRRLGSVDALVPGRLGLYLLDRLGGAVHLVSREGQVLATFGRGELMQPVALALDRHDRPYVLDGQDGSVKRLRPDGGVTRWSAAELGLQRIGGMAVDDLVLALSDRETGQVALFTLPAQETR